MLLAIDVGNTNIVFALVEGETCLKEWRLVTDPKRTSDEYSILFSQLLALSSYVKEDIDDVVLACVVPQNLFQLKKFVLDFLDKTPLLVGDKSKKIGISILLNRPNEIGDDRLINALAAYKCYGKTSIIIDFGTATNFDIVTDKGEYLGGVISPGINLSINALHKAAAKLPEIAISSTASVIGKSTVEAMQSGIYFGYIGLIEGIVSRIKTELESDEVITIATGGLAGLFAKATPMIDHLEPELTIVGLNEFYKLNKV